MAARIADPSPARAARAVLDARCLVGIGSTSFLVELRHGKVVECRRGLSLLGTWDFAVRGPAESWAALWTNPPAPGEHDVFALYKTGRLALEGRLEPFLAHLQFFKDLLESPRAA